MKTVFVIKDRQSDLPHSAAWDETTAIERVYKLNSVNKRQQYNYTEVPLYFEDGTEVKIIAPPIEKKYL